MTEKSLSFNYEVQNEYSFILERKWDCPKHKNEQTRINPEEFHKEFQKEKRLPETNSDLHRVIYEIADRNPKAMFPCSICKMESRHKGLLKWVLEIGGPRVLHKETFETFKSHSKLKDSERMAMIHPCQEFISNPRGLLLLTGSTGSGKDHLAMATMKGIMAKQDSGNILWMTQADMILQLRETYGSKEGKTKYLLDTWARKSLIVLSDVGLSYGGNDDLMHLHWLIDRRYQDQLPIIITTNLDWDHTESKELNLYLGPRISSRLGQMMFTNIKLPSSDVRKLGKEKYFA